MNKWIETYMEEHDLKPNELFMLDSQTFKGEYCFNESGDLLRPKGNGYENVSVEVLGRIMAGYRIEKVKTKGRYIPKKGELYYFVGNYGEIIESRHNTEQDEFLFKHNLLFITEEEARDYKWFLDQVDKYKKEFVEGEMNHYFYYAFKTKRIGISWDDNIKGYKFYFGNGENIEEFRNVVGDDRIKKYMFGVYE